MKAEVRGKGRGGGRKRERVEEGCGASHLDIEHALAILQYPPVELRERLA